MPSKFRVFSPFLLSLVLCTSPALALTGKDVMEKMNKDVRWGYVSGMVDMLSYRALLDDDKARAECLYKWFYKTDETPNLIYGALDRYANKAAQGIIIVFAKRACGE